MDVTKAQFEGMLLGLAVADALGSTWEGMSNDIIFDMGPADRIVEHASGETIHYTDDTQMTISIAETLIELGTIDEALLVRKFAENYHPDRGYGQGARRIINAIGFGEDWQTLAATIFNGEGSLGNGAAMRVSPIGLLFAHDLERVVDEAERSARPTHRHEIGIDSARIMAVAAALAARSSGQAFDRGAFLETLQETAQTEEFRWQLGHARQLAPHQSLAAFGNSLEAHRSVVTSIMCFANSPDDYAGAIARAIGKGGDVDTLAAMTGTLAGARLGISGVPARLIAALEDGYQGRKYLFALAESLHARWCRDRGRD